MFGTEKLDNKNTYSPNLQYITESENRTYGEANSFFRKEELYLQDIERRIKSGELSNPEDIYDECHAIASDLAKCCEMYLKALYIFENNIPGNRIDSIWEKLKKIEYQTDKKGNLIYRTSNGIITFLRYDDNNNPIVDLDGKSIYFDEIGNTYNERNRGSKIAINGHQLDRLIELLSLESRLYLETRMLSIPMNKTETNGSISIIDFLQNKGILSSDEYLTKQEYDSWIEKHKKTFEVARYSGQNKSDVNVEFLYHLAKQIKAVAQYRIKPRDDQIFTITDEELSKLPTEIANLASFNSKLLSEKLIKLIVNNENIKEKVSFMFKQNYILPKNIKPSTFCKMLETMSIKEIFYTSYICYISDNYQFFKDNSNKINDYESSFAFEIVRTLNLFNLTEDKIVSFFCQLKTVFEDGFVLNSKNLMALFKLAKVEINKYSYIKNSSFYNVDNKINSDINIIKKFDDSHFKI